MTAGAIIDEVRRAGGDVFAIEGRVRVRIPPGLDAAAIGESVRRHKRELLHLLTRRPPEPVATGEGQLTESKETTRNSEFCHFVSAKDERADCIEAQPVPAPEAAGDAPQPARDPAGLPADRYLLLDCPALLTERDKRVIAATRRDGWRPPGEPFKFAGGPMELGDICEGWEPRAWAAELRRKAGCCESDHPETATRYREWAGEIERRIGA